MKRGNYVGLDIEHEDGKIWCVGVGHEGYRDASRDWRTMLPPPEVTPIFHNAKYDLARFSEEGVEFPDFHDTILEAHLLGYRDLALRKLTPIFLDVHIKENTIIGKKGARFEDAPESVIIDCSMDAWASWALHEQFYPQIEANGWVEHLERAKKITRVVMDMEATGLPISQERLTIARRALMRRKAILEKQLREAGVDDYTKADLVGQKFWRGKKTVRTTKQSGRLSTTAAHFREFAGKNDKWIESFIELKQLDKLDSTYLLNWKGKDWLHPSINITGTATWRFSQNDPNLSNVAKNEDIPLYQIFVAPEGWVFISFDYSQIELRRLANASQDSNLMQAYMNNEDLHNKTLAGVPDLVTMAARNPFWAEKARRIAKILNFGVVYGITGHGISNKTRVDAGIDITSEKGDEFIDGFFDTYPEIRPWQLDQVEFAREHGYVLTMEGRPLYLPGIFAGENSPLYNHAINQCSNYGIQGGANEVVQDAMIRCPKYLVNQVYDELLYLVPENEAQDYFDYLSEALVDTRHDVPYTVEGSMGKTWGDIKHMDARIFDDGDEDAV